MTSCVFSIVDRFIEFSFNVRLNTNTILKKRTNVIHKVVIHVQAFYMPIVDTLKDVNNIIAVPPCPSGLF